MVNIDKCNPYDKALWGPDSFLRVHRCPETKKLRISDLVFSCK